MISKSFPKLQTIFTILTLLLFSCQKEKTSIIKKEQFIQIYARILIIDQMSIEEKLHDQLLQKLYHENNITQANIDSTVSFYNSNPKEWVEVYDRVRETILELKNKYKTRHPGNLDSLSTVPGKSVLNNEYRK
jgi:Domain of unknown function (DUF4296)